MELLDCTLRDGANVVGNGFSAQLTRSMLQGLIGAGVQVIEFGNAHGLGGYEASNAHAPLTDREYLELAQPYVHQAELGMFLGAGRATRQQIQMAADMGLSFLRVGIAAGDGEKAVESIRMVKDCGLKARYSLMKAYLLPPEQLAQEAAMLESCGLDEITVMDSAGTMLPQQVTEYVAALKQRISIPIGFHGHNNMGLATANAIAAWQAGAQTLDCGLMGMARSAGNMATEVAIAAFQRLGQLPGCDLYRLLDYIDSELGPAMRQDYGYHMAITPLDLILGYSGCHSSQVKRIRPVAESYGVPLYRLITKVSEQNKKSPPDAVIQQVAAALACGA